MTGRRPTAGPGRGPGPDGDDDDRSHRAVMVVDAILALVCPGCGMLLHMETNYDERAIRSVNHRPGCYDIEIDGEIVGTPHPHLRQELVRQGPRLPSSPTRSPPTGGYVTRGISVARGRPTPPRPVRLESRRHRRGPGPSAHHALATTIAETAEDVLPPLIADDDRENDTVELVDHDGSDRYPPATIAVVGSETWNRVAGK